MLAVTPWAAVISQTSAATAGFKLMIRFRIDEILKVQGKSAYWLANQIGMGHGNLWKYRKSKANTVNLEMLERICIALECGPGDVLTVENPKTPGSRRASVGDEPGKPELASKNSRATSVSAAQVVRRKRRDAKR